MRESEDEIARVAREILRRSSGQVARRGGPIAALTGAGVSVESGIPDFRSPDGIWERYDPEEYATIDAFLADPPKVWRFLLDLGDLVLGARPNPAHVALADLERAGALAGVATQNVDGLHQAAGSRRVLELHGGGRRLRCARCGLVQAAGIEDVRATVRAGGAPSCDRCRGPVKPDVVLFGEMLPQDVFREAAALARSSSVLLVAGTSAQVWPAAGLPALARASGALVVEVNLEPTALTGGVAGESLFGRAGEVLPALARAILRP